LAFLYRDKNGEIVTEIVLKPEEYIRKQNVSPDSSD